MNKTFNQKAIEAFQKINSSIKEAFLNEVAAQPAQPVAPQPTAQTPQPAITLTDFTLEDGATVISVEGELAPGSIVTVAGTPIPDGEYRLADGSLMRCEGGIITEYVPAQTSQTAAPQTQTPAPVAQSKTQTKINMNTNSITAPNKDKEIASLKLQISNLEKIIKTIGDNLTIVVGEVDAQSKATLALAKDVAVISDQPDAKPIVVTDQNENKSFPTDKYEKDRLFTQLAKERLQMLSKKK